jgi:hypothetical protein
MCFGKQQGAKIRCVLCPFEGGIMKCLNMNNHDKKMREINKHGSGPSEDDFFDILDNHLDPEEYRTKKQKEE